MYCDNICVLEESMVYNSIFLTPSRANVSLLCSVFISVLTSSKYAIYFWMHSTNSNTEEITSSHTLDVTQVCSSDKLKAATIDSSSALDNCCFLCLEV